jgi:hypothetical protein
MNPSFLRRGATSLEPLESRIAPARVIQVGAPTALGNDVDYTDSDPSQKLFVNTELGTDQISTAVGGGVTGVADTFYIKLTAGDVLQIFNSSSSFNDFLTVKSGTMVAFFVDRPSVNFPNGDNEVQANELTGISMGPNTSFILRGAVEGDIVTNLNVAGTSATINMSGLTTSAIKNVTIGGNGVGGSIIAGGAISNLTVNGEVDALLAGSAANGRAIDFFPNVGTEATNTSGEGTLAFTPAAGVAGPSIQKTVIDGVLERVQAGDGGFGAKGGSLKSIRIIEDATGGLLYAGDGGAAGGGKPNGGAGGTVKTIIFAPPDAGDDSPNSLIEVRGGDGGLAPLGKAGAGGAVSNVLMSFRLINGKPFATTQLVQDNVTIAGGAGGDGKIGGKGGKVSNSTSATVTPLDAVVGSELQILGGAGGDSTAASGGKTGAGGSISGVDVRNQFIGAGGGISMLAGDGGVGAAGVNGAKGGSITKALLLGSSVSVFAGDGSNGLKGGAGGTVKQLTVDAVDTIFSRSASINAGTGGNGLAGAGGSGGKMSTVRIENGDFTVLNINEGASANGGDSSRGKGGVGGSVSGLDLFDSDLNTGANGIVRVRTGEGGDGTTGGGKGGELKGSRFSGTGAAVQILAGNGGDVKGSGAKGKGGVGGSISGFELVAEGFVNSVPAGVLVSAGIGGDGAGAGGSGANGGNLLNVSVRSEGGVTLRSGDGGGGTTGKPGDGGSIRTSGGFANQSAGFLIAGDAGPSGAKPGKGGSILGTAKNPVGVYAQTDITVSAGDGTHGGGGGSLMHVGYGSTSSTLVPTPNGNIIIEAGDGSADGPFAGAGGSLRDVSGAVSSGINRTTIIRAGEGGSGIVSVSVAETTPGNGATQEVQTIDLSNLATTPGAMMTLTFGPGSTPKLPVVPSATQSPADYAAQLEQALNTLPGIGGVTVIPGATRIPMW